MSYTVGTMFTSVPILMAGRVFSNSDIAEACRKSILELSEDYDFPGLQQTGPTVALTPGVSSYSPNFFLTPGPPTPTGGGDQNLEVDKLLSIFLYYNSYVPLSASNSSNSGYDLTYSTIDDIEILINTLGVPSKWTRHRNLIYLAMCPNAAYPVYVRYKIEHPFPGAGTPTAGDDVIYLPNTWQDIIEYATAMRLATNTRMFDIATGLHTALYGDPKFQLTGGTEGAPGMIFARTSQKQRDQTTSVKSLRLRIQPYMR